MDVVPRRYTKTNYEIVDVGYKAPVCKPESELARQNRVRGSLSVVQYTCA